MKFNVIAKTLLIIYFHINSFKSCYQHTWPWATSFKQLYDEIGLGTCLPLEQFEEYDRVTHMAAIAW